MRNIKAYKRNVRRACAAFGNRVPQGYHTSISDDRRFVVYSGANVVGRLSDWEDFL